MKDSLSPEEKLLRLIKGPKKNALIKSLPLGLVAQIKGRYFNRATIIWVIFILSSSYLIISLLYPLVGLKKIKPPAILPRSTKEQKRESHEEAKPYEFYLSGIKNRQIFTSPSGGSALYEGERPASAATVDVMKDISLVGIIAGENPQAVIEDKKTQKTYYVTKGQFIGELEVQDIGAGKIIINYRGERYELYL